MAQYPKEAADIVRRNMSVISAYPAALADVDAALADPVDGPRLREILVLVPELLAQLRTSKVLSRAKEALNHAAD